MLIFLDRGTLYTQESVIVLGLKILGLMVLCGGAGYLIGSIPTGYLLVRWKSSGDIRTMGSGNVGSLNSYLVTRSKLVGATVLVVDFLKGVAAVAVAGLLAEGFIYLAAAGLGAVLGHNFPFWLKFKGGRGLATGAGVMIGLGWIVVLIWVTVWGIGYLATKNVNIGSAIASVLTLVLTILAPSSIIIMAKPAMASIAFFKYFVALMFGIILIKLIEPVLEYLQERKKGQA